MNLSEMKTALKRYGFDDTDPLTTWLNAAMREVELANNWRCLLTEVVIPVTVGFTDFIEHSKILSYQYYDANSQLSEPLEYLDYRRFLDIQYSDPTKSTDQVSDPKYYSIFRDDDSSVKLIIYPQSTVIAGRLMYLRYATEMSDGYPQCDFPEQFHYLIVRGAAAIGLEAENEEDRAAVAWQRFHDGIEKAIAQEYPTTVDENQQVQDAQGYGGY